MNWKVTEKNVSRVMETYKPLLLQNIIVTEQFIENMRDNRVLPETMIKDVQVGRQATRMKRNQKSQSSFSQLGMNPVD